MQEIDQFIINHFNMAAGVFVIIAGILKLAWDSKANGTKLDTLLTKNDNMQLEVNKQSIQMAAVAKDVGEIKNDTRSHDKEISSINARLAVLENQKKIN